MVKLGTNLLPFLGLWPGGDLGPYTIYTTRRRGIVWYLRAPPRKPPSYLQRRQRNTWSFAARVWSAMPQIDRDTWRAAARLAHLSISGYNLFIYYQTTKDVDAIKTVARQSGIALL